MLLKKIEDENLNHYKKPSLLLAFPYCSWKCEKECGKQVCQNSILANAPTYNFDIRCLVDAYLGNKVTSAVVCAGLEPFDSWDNLIAFISLFRYYSPDDIVIYTGYKEEEIKDKLYILSLYEDIIVKFGRYIPASESVYDEILGVELASSNQYAKVITYDEYKANRESAIIG